MLLLTIEYWILYIKYSQLPFSRKKHLKIPQILDKAYRPLNNNNPKYVNSALFCDVIF